ncbi:MAG: sugar phosphate isomerase/epimerase, partial [Firmicutes bacterium]|nr:sugar phosphate isomerase/epimerase [Bacillota bacterium]
MKLGVLTVLFGSKSLEETLKYLSGLGVQAVEIGTGGFPGNAHANTDELLADESKITAFKELVQKYDMEISALSCHGNPVHPQKQIAEKFHKDFEKTVLLAEKLGINRVISFSG